MRVRAALAAACFVWATARPSVASADDGAPHAPPTVWYGWEILAADFLSDAAMIGAIASPNDGSAALGLTGFAGYLGAAPIIHGAHGRGGAAAGSLVLRLVLPIVAAGIGAAATSSSCNSASSPSTSSGMDFSGVDCGIGRGFVVLLAATAGMVTAQAIDIAALSYAPAPTSAQPETTPAPLWLVQPSVGTLRDSERRLVPTFGVVVSF